MQKQRYMFSSLQSRGGWSAMTPWKHWTAHQDWAAATEAMATTPAARVAADFILIDLFEETKVI